MATSYEKIKGFLDKQDWKYRVKDDEGSIILGFSTERYQDKDGEKHITLVIKLEEDGGYIKFFAPNLYYYKDGPNKLAVFQTCLMTSWYSKGLQFEYDDQDGELRGVFEFPLEDAELTERQMMRILHAIVSLVDDYDSSIRAAMESGKIHFPEREKAKAMRAFMESLEDLGPEGVQKLAEEIKALKGKGKKAPDQL